MIDLIVSVPIRRGPGVLMNATGNTPGTHFCQRLSRPQGHSPTGRIMSLKNSNDFGYLFTVTKEPNSQLQSQDHYTIETYKHIYMTDGRTDR